MSEQHKGYDPTSPNSGCGWVYRRPDGLRAKCGGPALCEVCKVDQAHADGYHHPGKQRAVAALKLAGYETNDPAQRNFYRRLGEGAQITHEQNRFLLNGHLKDLPAALNPITKERIEKAFREWTGKVNQNLHVLHEGLLIDADKAWAELSASLFPEEAPTDANPTGGST